MYNLISQKIKVAKLTYPNFSYKGSKMEGRIGFCFARVIIGKILNTSSIYLRTTCGNIAWGTHSNPQAVARCHCTCINYGVVVRHLQNQLNNDDLNHTIHDSTTTVDNLSSSGRQRQPRPPNRQLQIHTPSSPNPRRTPPPRPPPPPNPQLQAPTLLRLPRSPPPLRHPLPPHPKP